MDAFFISNGDLKTYLLKYHQFPGKYRQQIWETLLKLPKNVKEFSCLFSEELHFALSEKNFSTKKIVRWKNRKKMEERLETSKSFLAFRRTRKIVSMILNLAPERVVVSFQKSGTGMEIWLEELVFPFVKLFQNDFIYVFELSLMILNNYFKVENFEMFPNQNMKLLRAFETIFKDIESRIDTRPNLFIHFSKFGVFGHQKCIWRLLKTLMTEVFVASQWKIVMDHFFVFDGLFMHYFICSLLLFPRIKYTLMQLQDIDEFKNFFKSTITLSRKELIQILQEAINIYQIRHDNEVVLTEFKNKKFIPKHYYLPILASLKEKKIKEFGVSKNRATEIFFEEMNYCRKKRNEKRLREMKERKNSDGHCRTEPNPYYLKKLMLKKKENLILKLQLENMKKKNGFFTN